MLYRFPYGPLATNALLIGCSQTKKGVVIDPAMGSKGAILQKAQELGLAIEKIVLTHSHWDHFADAAEIKKATGAPLYVHPLDAQNVVDPGSDGIPLFCPIASVTPDGFLEEGQLLEVGALSFQVIHTPGHSPGGICLYIKERSLLISGDTLFQGTMGSLGLPTANPSHMWKSLKKLAHLPPETRVVPGHGEETTIGHERWLSQAEELFAE